MSERQKQNLSAYVLMLGVFSLILSAIIPTVVKKTVDNVTSVPVIVQRLDTVVSNQTKIINTQKELYASKRTCEEQADSCKSAIHDLNLRVNGITK